MFGTLPCRMRLIWSAGSSAAVLLVYVTVAVVNVVGGYTASDVSWANLLTFVGAYVAILSGTWTVERISRESFVMNNVITALRKQEEEMQQQANEMLFILLPPIG